MLLIRSALNQAAVFAQLWRLKGLNIELGNLMDRGSNPSQSFFIFIFGELNIPEFKIIYLLVNPAQTKRILS